MRSLIKKRFILLILAPLLLVMLAATDVIMADSTTVELGTAKSFGVLAGSEITNTGTTWIGGSAGGDVGLYPGTAFTGSEDITIENGDIYINDAVAEQAQQDLLIAYNDAAGRTSDETISDDLAGKTLTPGVYKADSSMAIDETGGTLTLDAEGDPNAVFIFQAESTLTTASASEIELINGAQPCRVFWQVGSSATLGTNSTFVGHILATTSITANTGAEVQGQLLAMNGAVTLDSNTITNDVCLPPDEEPDPEPEPDPDPEPEYGELMVEKLFEGEGYEGEMPDAVEITIEGPSFEDNVREDNIVELDEDNDWSYAWDNLDPGEYTLTEEDLGESWEVSFDPSDGVNVEEGVTTDVTITNTFDEEPEPEPEYDELEDTEEDELPETGGGVIPILPGIGGAIAVGGAYVLIKRKK